MKILVTASAHNVSDARSIMVALEQAGFDTVGLRFNQNWQKESLSKLENHLFNTGHILCVVDADSLKENWFSLITGLVKGKSLSLYIYYNGPSCKPEKWLDDIPCFTSVDKVLQQFKLDSADWDVKQKKNYAKAALLELGISWHSDSFIQCVKDGDYQAVEFFIDSGFPVNIRDKYGVSLPGLATRAKHLNIVKLLFERGADINYQSDDRGYTPLMDAVQQGDAQLMDFLLLHGAKLDLQSKDGQTALVLAVGSNDEYAVTQLLKKGANPDLSDKLGLNARKYARLFHNPKVEKLFESLAVTEEQQ